MGRAEDKRQAARDAAAHHGLRAAVPHYLEAAQALVDAHRAEEAADLLGELLTAQERKKGLFGKVEKNPLGPARAQAALKFAEVSRLAAPSEDVLQLLQEIALEFPDEPVIRRSNADALYAAGYLADASEEYRYCLHLNPEDGQILTRLTESYAEMGRNDLAIEFLRRGMRVHAEAGDFGQSVHLAIRWLGMAPGAAEDVLRLLREWPADALRRQAGGINQLAMLVKKDDVHPAAWHKQVAAEFAQLGASGRPDAATPVAEAALPEKQPATEQSITKPAAAQPISSTKPAPVEPPKAPLEPPKTPGIGVRLPSSAPAPQAPRPQAPPQPQRQAAVAPPQPLRAPAPPPAAQSPAEVKPAAPVRPPSQPAPGSLPTLEKVIEEADKKPAQAPPPAVPARPSAAPPAQVAAVAVRAAQPGGAAGGIKNFARRKARELYDARDYVGASQSLERVARFGADSETLHMLLHCYTELKKPEDAKRVALQLADLEVEAGNAKEAVKTLNDLAKWAPDPEVLQKLQSAGSAR